MVSHIWKLLALMALSGYFIFVAAQLDIPSNGCTWEYTQSWNGAAAVWGDTTSVRSYVLNSKGTWLVYNAFQKDSTVSPVGWRMNQKAIRALKSDDSTIDNMLMVVFNAGSKQWDTSRISYAYSYNEKHLPTTILMSMNIALPAMSASMEMNTLMDMWYDGNNIAGDSMRQQQKMVLNGEMYPPGADTSFKIGGKDRYTYSANSIERVLFIWDTTILVWREALKYTTTHDNNKVVQSTVLSQFVAGSWIDSTKDSMVYVSNHLSEQVTMIRSGSVWKKSSRTVSMRTAPPGFAVVNVITAAPVKTEYSSAMPHKTTGIFDLSGRRVQQGNVRSAMYQVVRLGGEKPAAGFVNVR